MFSIAKRITSAVLAGAVVLGSLAVYPNISKKGETIVRAAELPAVMDAASSVNYSTILGRGVDYGIVADTFQQRDHMESTFAVINFAKIEATKNTFSTIDLNPVGSTAQVLVHNIVGSGTVLGAEVSAPPVLWIEGNGTNVLNIEGSSQVFTDGYYHFQNFKQEVKTVNDNTDGNIKLIMNDAYTASKAITNKIKNGYAIDYRDYYDDTSSTSSATLDLTKGDFANKVVYIKVDDDLMSKVGVAEGLNIIKDSSTVIVFNLDDSVNINATDKTVPPMNGIARPIGKEGKDKQDYVLINKFKVSVDGGNSWIYSDYYSGRYKDSDKDPNALAALINTQNCDREICQKIIWNITTTKPVALENTSGLFIAPNTFVETMSTCAGWIVANEFANSNGEWHYIYGGGSQNVLYDEQGEIHFAANKTFTHEWNGTATEQDTTIYTAPKTYSFYWYENNSDFSITDPESLVGTSQCTVVDNEATNKLQFPILKFYNDGTDETQKDPTNHHIQKNNEKTFYYTIREVNAGTTNSDGIQISDGYIDIILTVKNNNGELEYYVYSETHLGDTDHTLYETNEGTPAVGNDAEYKGKKVRQTRMSGIEFFLGECFNYADTSIDLKKTVTGDYTPVAGETFTYYVYNKALNKYFYYDDSGKLVSSTEKNGVKVEYGQDKVTKVAGLPVGEYTVSEDTADAARRGYLLTAPADKDVKVSLNSTPVVNLVNEYKRDVNMVGKIELTKTIKGLVTDEDLSGLTFTVRENVGGQPGDVVWEHKLGDSVFTVTTDPTTKEKTYKATIDALDQNKTYFVTETLVTLNGYEAAKVSYVLTAVSDTFTGDTTTTKDAIIAPETGSKVEFTNEYPRITGKLIVDKVLKDDAGKEITGNDAKEFSFTVAVGKDEGYLQADGKIGVNAYTFKVTPGTNTEIPVDYAAFNKELTINEVTSNLPEIDGYTFKSANVSFVNNNKSVSGTHKEVTAVITNNYEKTPAPVGTVVLTKTISGAELADFEKITFEVKEDGTVIPNLVPDLTTTNVGTVVGTNWIKEADGKYTFTISNIPVNTEVEVNEKTVNFLGSAQNKYTINSSSVNYGKVTVASSTSTNEIVLKNDYDVNKGSIVISKSISGAELADFETIHFTVKADGVEVKTVPDLKTSTVGTNVGKDWIDEGNGKYTFTISDVPVNTEYDVTETLATFKNTTIENKYTLNSSNSELKGSQKVLLKGESYEIALKNAYDVNKGNVIISKSISGATLADFEEISFKVTADGSEVTTVPVLSTSTVGTVAGTDWIDAGNGTYTFTISNVPVNTKYEVTETLATLKGSASTTYTLDQDKSKTKGEVTVIAADKDYTLVLNNTYKDTTPITVDISKQEINTTSGDEVPGATLVVTYVGNDTSVDLTGVKLTRNGSDVTSSATLDKRSVAFVTEDAKTSITGLVPGDYTLEETIQPTGYGLQTTKINFTVGSDGKVSATSTIAPNVGKIEGEKTVIILDEKLPITVDISKQDINETSGEEVPGAKLVVTYVGTDTSVDLRGVTLARNGSNVTSSATLDKSSVAFITESAKTSITGLVPGDYTLEETIKPTGYSLQTTKIYFTVGSDGKVSATSTIDPSVGKIEGDNTVIILDEKTGTFTVNISKRDINQSTGAEVDGAELVVTYVGTDTSVDLTGVTLTRSGSDVTSTATRTASSVTFKSTGAQTSINGLVPGDYTLEETIAPDGYNKQTTKIYFTVGTDGKVSATSTIDASVGKIENDKTVVILDEPYTVNISKRDVNETNGDEVSGAVLKVDYVGGGNNVDLSGVTLKQGSTDVTSSATRTTTSVTFTSGSEQTVITGLKAGKYTLTETTEPAGYELQQTVIGFTVGTDGKVTATSPISATAGMISGTDTVVILDKKVDITVNISKKDINEANGDEVPGAILKIDYVDGGNNVDLSKVTLKQGTTDVTNATTTSLSKTSVSFESGSVQTVVVGIQPGNYTLTETTAPNGYELQQTVIAFTVGTDGKVTATTPISATAGMISGTDTVVILDEKITSTVNISKRDVNVPNGDEVPGAILKIDYVGGGNNVDLSNVTLKQGTTDVTNASSSSVGKTSVSFESGSVQTVVTGIQPGNYTLTETTAPDGFEKQETVIAFTVGTDGKVTATTPVSATAGMISGTDTVVILDKKIITVDISKRDINVPNGDEVEGAKLVVTYLGNDASVDLSAASVTLTRGGKDVTTSATKTKTTIAFITETAQTTITGLVPGAYSLEETVAPDGYEMQTTKIFFTVGTDGKVSATSTIDASVGKIENNKTVVILDKPQTVNISKRDVNEPNGDEVPGATLKIDYVGGGNNVDLTKVTLKQGTTDVTSEATRSTTSVTFTSGSAQTVVTGLKPGKYTLTETVKPNGYELQQSVIEFTIGLDGKVTATTPIDATVGLISGTDTVIILDEKESTTELGSLTISKTISGAPLADFEKLTFTAVGDQGTTLKIPDLTSANVTNGTWKSEGNGKYTYTVGNLVAGEEFTVTETLDSFLGTVTTEYQKDSSKSDDEETVTIVANGTVTAVLTDTYAVKQTGSLTISKTISGAPLEDFEKLTFTAVGDKGTTLDIPDLTKANVENGKWTNEGNGKYTYTVSNLTPDEKFTVTETLDSFLGTVTTQYEKDTSKSTDKAEATIVAGQNVTAALTDTYTTKTTPTTGSLTVSKTISGAPLEDFEKLTFTAVGDKGTTLDIPDLTKANVENGKWTNEGNGKYTYTVPNLTPDEKFTVTETLDSFLGTVTTQYEKDTSKSTDKAEATIVGGQNVTAALTDTYTTKTTPTTGSLTVSKTVSGAPLEDFEKLTFTAVGDKGTTLTIPDLTSDNVKNNTWKDEGNGKYTYTVSDLTPDEKFTVTETLDSFLGTVTTQYEKDTSKSTDKAEATIVGGQNVTAALTDTYTVKQAPVPTGSISITKSVVGTDPTSGSFTFTVKCGDDYVQDTTGTVASAYADFTITDGETIDITGLELGKVYVVAEDEVTGLASGIVCTTTYSDSDKVVLDANTTSGSVTITNTFTDTNVPNPTTGSITVTKLVTGSTTSGMPDKYKFYIECGDQYVQQDGSLGDTKYLFEVGANSDVTIDNLDTNTKTYKVVEDTVDTSALPSGYACDEPSYSTPTITLDPNNESGSVVITNNFTYTAPNPVPVTGSLKITLDLDGEVPSDAPNKTFAFVVTGPSYPNGTTIYITGEDDLTIDNLLPGTYKVVESKPDAEITNYDLSVSGHDGISIDVVAGETATRTIVNEYTYNPPKPQPPTKGDITFTKTFGGDVTEREAAGDNLYFVITNENGEYLALDGTLSSTEVRITLADLDHTDGTRIWTKTINDVPLGRYTVTEHNDEIFIGGSNIPYTMEATSVRTDSTSIDSSSLSGNLDLTNIYVNGPDLDITLSKQDIAGKEIAEAELTFTSLDGYDLSNVVVTQNGVQVKVTISPDKHAISFITVDTAPSIIKGLRAGRYELKETVTPKAYLTAEAIQFSLLPDGSTECGGKVTVAGSPIIMVDKADPNYEVDKDTEVISANREPKSIPATGETASVVSKAGIAVLSLSAACFTGYFVYNAKKRKAEEE